MIKILEVNGINRDEREKDINIGVLDQSIKHIEMDVIIIIIIIIISLLNNIHSIRGEQKIEKHITDIREIETNIKIYKINIKVYKISIMTCMINIRIQDNDSMIIIAVTATGSTILRQPTTMIASWAWRASWSSMTAT